MTFLEARSLDEADRPALTGMLAQEHAAGWLVDQLRRRSSDFDDFAVWRDGEPVGALRGNLRTSFTGNDAFDEFELPRGPHAFLSGIFIATQARGTDAAALLVRSFVVAAEERDATFIAGTMDRSFDGGVRRAFFEKCGFTITPSEQFGAPTNQVLDTLSSL